MALPATIFKAEIDISDMDRHYYRHHALTLARHPSETDERMMVRLLAFLHHAEEGLAFARGLSETAEPDVWLKDAAGRVLRWIEVGLPDARRLVQVSRQAEQAVIYAYGRGASRWWQQVQKTAAGQENLSVYLLPVAVTQAMAAITQRFMRLACSVQDGQLYLTGEGAAVQADLPSYRVMPAP
ncbi:MAG: YaeQ family protein [Oxalobacter formigenes]|nr:YaeQ family protein [Oxalobacter formigenes]